MMNDTIKSHSTRIQSCFARLKQANQCAFSSFLTAGDPDYDSSLSMLQKLPEHGVDIIELGMPFTDPMADGPAIQASSLRALAKGQNLQKTLDMVTAFRKTNDETPVILMGYFNPIYHYGVNEFLKAAKQAGVDGLIVVDLPPEEDEDLCLPAHEMGIDFIRLLTPTSDEKRLPKLLERASGYLYYVSMAGITGTREIDIEPVEQSLAFIRNHTDLPIAVGFGVKTPAHAAKLASIADAVVVGSSLVNIIETALKQGVSQETLTQNLLQEIKSLADATHNANI